MMVGTGPLCRYVISIFLNSHEFFILIEYNMNSYWKKASDLEILFKVLAGPQFKELAHHFEKKVDFKKLKYYYIDNLQGNVLASDLSTDAKHAIHKVNPLIKYLTKWTDSVFIL